MNNKKLNIALGKLFNGIELDTHKIELGLLDDLAKISNTKEVTFLRIDVNTALDKVKKFITKGISISQSNKKSLEKKIDTILKSAKELGIENDIKSTNEYKEALKSIDIFENNLEFFKRVLKSIPNT